MAGFEELGIGKERVQSLRTEGIQEATPIQEGAIPVILQGSDVICQAQTGTGKTLAFLLPMLEKIRADRDQLQGLILTPTRELALQITTELKKRIATQEEFSVLAVYGGQDVESQLRKLKRAVHIVVATPGRLLDHIRRGTISLGAVKMLVLDEADQMLHMGFLTEVEEIMQQMAYRKQTMLFSATMPAGVRSLAARFMIEPKDITVRTQQVTLKAIRQLAVEVSAKGKEEHLKRLLGEHNPYLGVIFCRTKKRASALNDYLQENGFSSDELHGDLSQAKREQVMRRFRDAKLQLLVATDVAARGLDVEGVTHVFNYDIPENAEGYIHRIGRTGRAGEDGIAITLVSPHDRLELAAIERGIHQTIPRENSRGGVTVVREARKQSDKREGSEGARRGEGRRGAGAGGGWSGGRSGGAGRGGRGEAGAGRGRGEAGAGAGRGRGEAGGEKRAGAGGAYSAAAKRGEGRGAARDTVSPQWGAGTRSEAPRGRGAAAAGSSRSGGGDAQRGGRGRYSTPAREEGAGGAPREAGRSRGEGASGAREADRGRSEGARGRGASGASASRSGGRASAAPQFPGSGERNRGGGGGGGGRTSGSGGDRSRSGGGGRPSGGGRSGGGRSGGGKPSAGGRPQRGRSR
ncbi:ATP-dependent RNA helicase DeaD [Paenibacillus sp. OV219]|nr:ATP-dependent RNA helicase DeaD [Paenibacillus sp. OV219]